MDFYQFSAQFMRLYAQEDYAGALALINEQIHHDTAHEALLLCFRAAMQARLDQPQAAIQTLETALDEGFWYHEDGLRADPDFATLQELDAFQALLNRTQAERLEASKFTRPALMALPPQGGAGPFPLLMSLHGSLGNMESFAAYWLLAAMSGWMVALPQSSQSTWLSGFFSWDDIDMALAEIATHYDKIRREYPLDAERIVLGGFSTGAMVAVLAATRGVVPAAGLLLIEGWDAAITDTKLWQGYIKEGTIDPGLRVYLVAGPTRHVQGAEMVAAMLTERGAVCEIETTSNNDYHGFPPDFHETLMRALDFLGG